MVLNLKKEKLKYSVADSRSFGQHWISLGKRPICTFFYRRNWVTEIEKLRCTTFTIRASITGHEAINTWAGGRVCNMFGITSSLV